MMAFSKELPVDPGTELLSLVTLYVESAMGMILLSAVTSMLYLQHYPQFGE